MHNNTQEARRMPSVSLMERYLVFIREQENILKSMAQGSQDDGTTDLAGYVEYQRNFK
jgi:hypothetical protein